VNKLNREPIEDYGIDFEEGFGSRPDEEEDHFAQAAAEEMAAANALLLNFVVTLPKITLPEQVAALEPRDALSSPLLTHGETQPSRLLVATAPRSTGHARRHVQTKVPQCPALKK
jgi:uncharacterized protein DUF6986